MTGYMNIRITVAANQARKAIADTESQVSRLNARMAAAGTGTEQFARKQDVAFKAMNKWGNQLQWTGRQLQYNWTLPLAVAGGAATKFALDLDRSMTQVRKVYGDAALSAETITNELAALEKAFAALSNRYGIHQAEVADIAAGWAAAGASGLALAKNVELTMKTMILGELEAAEATKALISIQAQYGQTAEELADTMARLNAIENETGTNTHDLVVAFQRAAGFARNTGVDVQHLGAMIAAITPAAGTATQAGNSLKTIFQRLFSPTKEANRIFEEIGISTKEMSWQTANASVRLETLAGKWDGLSDSQRSVVATYLVGIEQGNRFVVLMEEMNRETGFYQRALNAAADDANYFAVAQNELNRVLDSSSHKWDQAIVILQNAMIKVIQPLLPMIIGLAQEVGQAATAFADLNPNVQKLIVFGALALALLGPMVRYFGSLFTLIAVLGRAVTATAGGFGALAGMLGLTSRAATVAAASTAAAAATSAGAAAAATGAATAASGGMLARMAAGIATSGAALTGAFATIFGIQSGIVARSGATMAASYSLNLAGLKMIARAQLAGLVATMSAGATAAATRFSAIMSGLLLPSFSATLARMTLLWNLHSVRLSAAMSGRMAVMVAWWGVSWRTGMLGTMRTALVAMVATMGAGMAAMLGPLARWAVFAGRNWTFIWTGMLDKMFVMLTRMTTVFYAGTTRLQSIGLVFGYAWSALWSGIGTAATRIWTVMNLGLLKISTATYSGLVALTAAFRNGMSIIFALTAFHLRGIWIALGNGLTKIWAFTLGRLKVMWTAFVTFLSSPGSLIAAFARMRVIFMAGMTGIMGVISGMGTAIMAILTSPWTLAIAAVIGLVILFRDQLAQVWGNIVDYFSDANNAVIEAFNALPVGIKNAVLKVIAVVRAAALQVYEWFSYLNPFARHSPSLVENVTNGMAVVRQQFGTLTQVQGPIMQAYASIKRLKDLTADLRRGESSIKIAEDIEKLAKTAPHAIPAYRQLVAVMTALTVQQERLADAIAAQEARTKSFKAAVDASSAALDRQKDILSDLEESAQRYGDAISAARDKISELASTPLSGMGAMEDAIFGNEMAQKRLRLEMMRMEDAGATFDDVKNKLAALNGELEMVRGEKETLRGMGAGSEILGTYDAQIKKLEDQKVAIEKSSAPIAKMSSELEKLQREAERMDLEKSLKFDPLTRQIENAANGMKEMPFATVISQIRENQAAIDRLTPAYDAANRAVEAQKGVIERAQAAHDSLQASYDLEQQKLEALRDAYQEISDAIGDVNSGLSDMRGAADSAIKAAEDKATKLSPAVENFRNAEGGNFADVGGGLEEAMKLGREGGLGDQSALIDDFTKGIEDELADSFGGLDMWGPFKDMWKSVVKWWDANVGPWISALGDFFATIFDGVDFVTPIKDKLNGIWESVFGTSLSEMDWGKLGTKIADGIRTALNVLSVIGEWIWDLFGEEVTGTLQTLWDFAKDIFTTWGELFGQLLKRAKPFLQAVKNLYKVIAVLLTPVVVALLAVIQTLWGVLNGVLGPILDWVVGLFKNLWQIVVGVIDMFIGLFTLDFGTFFSGLGGALKGLGGLLWDTIVSLGIVLINAFGALVDGIWDSLLWVGKMIWEGLEAGLKAIGLDWLVDIFGGIVDFVKDLFGIHSPSTVFSDIGRNLMEGLVNGATAAATAVYNFFKDLPGSIISFVGDASVWLYEKGKDVLRGLKSGMIDAVESVGTWLKELPGKVANWVGDTATWLIDKGKDLIKGLIDGATKKGEDIAQWFLDLPGKIQTWIGDTATWLIDNGYDMVTGFIDGIVDKIPDLVEWFMGLPDKIQEWIGDTATYLKDNGKDLVEGFIKGIINHAPQVAMGIGIVLLVIVGAMVAVPLLLFATGIALIVGFVKGIAEAIWSKLGPKLEELKTFLSQKFTDIKDAIVKKWNEVWDRIKDVAQSGIDWIQEKFDWMKDKVIGIFVTIRDWVGMVWGGLLEKFRTPIKIVFDFVNGNMIGPINGLLGKFPGGLQLKPLPTLKEGGLLKGPGTGTSDSILGVDARGVPTSRVSDGEYVVNAKATRENLSLLNALNFGKLPAFEGGGVMGGLRSIGGGLKDAGSWVVDKASDGAQWVGDKLGDLIAKGGRFAAEHILNPLRNTVKNMVPGGNVISDVVRGTVDKLVDSVLGKGDELDKQNLMLSGGTFSGGGRTPNGAGGLGPMAAAARMWVMQTFGINNIGGYANRNIAGTNSVSDHATGHAIDVMIPGYKTDLGISIGNRIASHFVTNPDQFGTKYVIWRDQINQGRGWEGYKHPGGGNSDTLAHRDHVHLSVYDQGGVLGSGALAMNMSGKPERVLNPRQTVAFEKLVSILDMSGVPSVAAMEAAIFRAETRAQQADTIGNQTTVQHTENTYVTNNFYGDLSFPNITDGDDADVFLRNLGDLAGGGRR